MQTEQPSPALSHFIRESVLQIVSSLVRQMMRHLPCILLIYACLASSYLVRRLPNFTARRLLSGRLQRVGTQLASKLRWEVIREDADDDEEGETFRKRTVPTITALTGIENPVKIDVDTLVQQWIEQNLAEGKAVDKTEFSLKSAIPLAISSNYPVELVNRTMEQEQAVDISVTYISEDELQKIWRWNMYKPMSKPSERYNPKEAFMLLDDEDMKELMGSYGDEGDGSGAEDIKEEIVTEQELRRVWEERGQVQWGMPAESFSEEAALLLLDSNVGSEYDSDSEDGHTGASASGDSLAEADLREFEQRYPGPANQARREAWKRVYDDLEDTSSHRPAWQRTHSFLTPDTDTQHFEGDIMFSNTYLTTRIPANWNDPEAGEMSEIYNSTSTMAMPGEPETDFTIQRPIWEQFNLPIGPAYLQGKAPIELLKERYGAKASAQGGRDSAGTETPHSKAGTIVDTQPGEGARESANSAATAPRAKLEIDWENFDFSATEPGLSGSFVEQSPPRSGDAEWPSAEVISQGLDDVPDVAAAVGCAGAGEAEDDTLSEEERAARFRARVERTTVAGMSCTSLDEPSFHLPEGYRERLLQSEGLVGYETWSKYGPEQGFDLDDEVWDDDLYHFQALQHLKNVTDLYLDDHSLAVAYQDALKNVTRVLNNAFCGTNYTQEAIPAYLTPDANRGIQYTNEVIEMKGKRILHPVMPDPAVEYANDTFTHNEDVVALNKIGTCRDQYDWRPRTDLVHEIEPHKVEKLKPVIDFINHAAQLQSTKDDIIIFNYNGGVIRHIVGLRSTLLQIAQQCYPQVKDLRLESPIMVDKFDIG